MEIGTFNESGGVFFSLASQRDVGGRGDARCCAGRAG